MTTESSGTVVRRFEGIVLMCAGCHALESFEEVRPYEWRCRYCNDSHVIVGLDPAANPEKAESP